MTYTVERVVPGEEPGRPAHQEKRKHHKRRNPARGLRALRFMNVVLFLLILGLTGYFLAVTAFRVKRVEVTGNTILTDYEVKNYVIRGKYRNNSVYEVLLNLVKPRKDIPFVSHVKVSLASPSTVRIRVTEEDLWGSIDDGSGKHVYFDGDGIVREISDRAVDGTVPFSGIDVTKAEAGKALPVRNRCIEGLKTLRRTLARYEITPDSIAVQDEMTVSVSCGTIDLSFGMFTDLDEKGRRASILLPQLSGKTGVLHLENWTAENTDIVFEDTAAGG